LNKSSLQEKLLKLVEKRKLLKLLLKRQLLKKAQAEVAAKDVDNNIVNEVIIDLTNTGVLDEDPEVSKAVKDDGVMHTSEKKEPTSK